MDLIDIELHVILSYIDEIDARLSKYSHGNEANNHHFLKWILYNLKQNDYTKYRLLLDSFFLRSLAILNVDCKKDDPNEDKVLLYEKLCQIQSLDEFEGLIMDFGADDPIYQEASLDKVYDLVEEQLVKDDEYNESLEQDTDINLKSIFSLVTNDTRCAFLKSFYLFSKLDIKPSFSYIYKTKDLLYKMIGLSFSFEGLYNYNKYMMDNNHDASDEIAIFLTGLLDDTSEEHNKILKQLVLEYYKIQKYICVNNLVVESEYQEVLENIRLIEENDVVEVLEILLSNIDVLAAIINDVFCYKTFHTIEEYNVSERDINSCFDQYGLVKVKKLYCPYYGAKIKSLDVTKMVRKNYISKLYDFHLYTSDMVKANRGDHLDVFEKRYSGIHWLFNNFKNTMPNLYRIILEILVTDFLKYCIVCDDEIEEDNEILCNILFKANSFDEIEKIIFNDLDEYSQIFKLKSMQEVFSYIDEKYRDMEMIDDSDDEDEIEEDFADEKLDTIPKETINIDDFDISDYGFILTLLEASMELTHFSEIDHFDFYHDLKQNPSMLKIIKRFSSYWLDLAHFESIGLENSYDGLLNYYKQYKDSTEDTCFDIVHSLFHSDHFDTKNITLYIIKSYYKIGKYLNSVDSKSLKKYVRMIEERDIDHTMHYFSQNHFALAYIMEVVFVYDLYGIGGKNAINIPYDILEEFSQNNTPEKVRKKLFKKGNSLN